MSEPRSYDPHSLATAAATALTASGVSQGDAHLVADSLVSADRRGVYSHGVIRLPLYIAALEAGGMNPSPNMVWERESHATAVLNADSAMGQVAMHAAVTRAADLARAFGVAAVSVEHSTHYGAGNYWSDMLTASGLIGLVTSTTGPVVAPFGGEQATLGTNPLTISFPSASDHPLTVDMATSAGAYGKVLAARNSGISIPEGWAVGPDGAATTDPATAIAGALLAFGGHKGSGLSVLLEALSASLTNASYAFETVDIWSTPSSRMNTGHFILALDPEHFFGLSHTSLRVRGLQSRVRASGTAGTLAPGDPEESAFASTQTSVEIAHSTAVTLDALFDRLDVTPPVER